MKKQDIQKFFENKRNKAIAAGLVLVLVVGGSAGAYALMNQPSAPATQEQTQTKQASTTKKQMDADTAKDALKKVLGDEKAANVEDVAVDGKTVYVTYKDAGDVDAAGDLELATTTGVTYLNQLPEVANAKSMVAPTKVTWVQKTKDDKVAVAYTLDSAKAPKPDDSGKVKPADVIKASDAYSLSHDVHETVKNDVPEQTKGAVVDKDKKPVVADNAEAPKEDEVKAAEDAKEGEKQEVETEIKQADSGSTDNGNSSAPVPSNNGDGSNNSGGNPPAPQAKDPRWVETRAAWDEPVYETRTRTVVDVPAHTEQRDTGKPKIVFSDGHVVYTNEERIAYQLAHDVAYRVEPLYETIEVPAKTHEESYQVQTGSIHHDAEGYWTTDY